VPCRDGLERDCPEYQLPDVLRWSVFSCRSFGMFELPDFIFEQCRRISGRFSMLDTVFDKRYIDDRNDYIWGHVHV
jgi:hypothetical protein